MQVDLASVLGSPTSLDITITRGAKALVEHLWPCGCVQIERGRKTEHVRCAKHAESAR